MEPPLHEFHIRKVEVRTGKNKGNEKFTTSLIIPPWVFTTRRRAKEVGDTNYFSCNFCKNEGEREATAQAVRLEDDEDGTPNFSLRAWPRDANAHSCNTAPTAHLVKEFRELCYAAVKNDPTKSLLTIYKENRSNLSKREKLDDDQKKAFFADLPDFNQISPSLYRYRSNFIPRAPQTYVSKFLTYTFIISYIL